MRRLAHSAHPAPGTAKVTSTDAPADATEPANCVSAELLTPRQVSELAQMSYHAVLRAVNDGELTASRLRGRLRVRRADFDAWVDGSRITPVKAVQLQLAEVASQRSERTPRPAAGSFDVLSAIEAEAS
jgi:excisionase family DNA binding protein